jgi:hypothetical protein
VSEHYALVVQCPVFYNIKALMMGLVSSGSSLSTPRSLALRGPPAWQLGRDLVGFVPPLARLQASDYMVFDWKPQMGTLLHVVPLLGGPVSPPGPSRLHGLPTPGIQVANAPA